MRGVKQLECLNLRSIRSISQVNLVSVLKLPQIKTDIYDWELVRPYNVLAIN